ncbi:MAG: large conductance mechanosensitive channel protein MscL [Verrucomicrobiae bacterium]|nr:large conductance mechanosensitive channel protein MscL [Verrucomicrobiae bacterium]NNJ87390.1 large conductance mechanosensitive channel protein MscL [Akkermansiaceae bacterium]
MLKDFKEFLIKGNAFDMAVGIILGGAFGLVVKSLVSNIIMPLIAGILKMPDFSQWFYAMDGKEYESLEAAQKAGATVAQGVFVNNVINLVIVGLALFIMVKYMEKAAKKKEEEEEEKPADPPKQEVLLEEIRDLLKK